MFGFFGRLANESLHVTDLHFCSPDAFRSFADKLCARADSGWKRVTLPVKVEGFRELDGKARRPATEPRAPTTACVPLHIRPPPPSRGGRSPDLQMPRAARARCASCRTWSLCTATW